MQLGGKRLTALAVWAAETSVLDTTTIIKTGKQIVQMDYRRCRSCYRAPGELLQRRHAVLRRMQQRFHLRDNASQVAFKLASSLARGSHLINTPLMHCALGALMLYLAEGIAASG
jgi:hypothetical protein